MKIHDKQKKPYFIKEPFGLPFELTEKGKYKQLKEKVKNDGKRVNKK